MIEEKELRHLLRQPAGPATDTAFESAVLDQIRRTKRRAAFLLVGVAGGVAILMALGLCALAAALMQPAWTFANMLTPFVEAFRPLACTVEVWADCALAATASFRVDLIELLLRLAVPGLILLILLEIGISRLVYRSFTPQTK